MWCVNPLQQVCVGCCLGFGCSALRAPRRPVDETRLDPIRRRVDVCYFGSRMEMDLLFRETADAPVSSRAGCRMQIRRCCSNKSYRAPRASSHDLLPLPASPVYFRFVSGSTHAERMSRVAVKTAVAPTEQQCSGILTKQCKSRCVPIDLRCFVRDRSQGLSAQQAGRPHRQQSEWRLQALQAAWHCVGEGTVGDRPNRGLFLGISLSPPHRAAPWLWAASSCIAPAGG